MKHPKVAIRLKEALEDNTMSSTELAERLGVNKSSVSQYLNGVYVPRHKRATKMGEILGVNPSWLMGADVPKKYNESQGKGNAYSCHGVSLDKIFSDKLLTDAIHKLAMLKDDSDKEYINKTLDILLRRR